MVQEKLFKKFVRLTMIATEKKYKDGVFGQCFLIKKNQPSKDYKWPNDL